MIVVRGLQPVNGSPDFRHRALRHHSQGVFEAERVFGAAIVNSDGKLVPTRYIAERHIKEDWGGIVRSVWDWLSRIRPETWMSRGYSVRPPEYRRLGRWGVRRLPS